MIHAPDREALMLRWARATAPRLILDYDGTLVPFRARPEDAAPDPETLGLLVGLAGLPDVRLLLASGRDRRTLEAWFGNLPIDLVAEHGFFLRVHGRGWVEALPARERWFEEVALLFRDRAERLPGAVVERKEHAIAWHYRGIEHRSADSAVKELLSTLSSSVHRQEFDILPGHAVVEVRSLGATKGSAATGWLAANTGDLLLAIGDDTTDEDLFRALPEQAVTIRVGAGDSGARYRLAGPEEVRELLSAFVGAPRTAERASGAPSRTG